jgi:hypothetical protein
MTDAGRLLLVAGVILIMAGCLFIAFDKIHFFGKLPGDINIQKEHFKFYFPLMTCIIVSLIISFLFFIARNIK